MSGLAGRAALMSCWCAIALMIAGCARSESPADGAANAAAAMESAPASATEGPRVETRPVTIYRRATSESLTFASTTGQIVWFGSAVDRARQIVQLVLARPGEGAVDTVALPEGIVCDEVYLDDRATMWVDLDGASLAAIRGSDDEQAVVGCLARTLVDALDEVERVGVLVDGEPRRTLAGHVDLTRTFTGREWPLIEDTALDAEEVAPE